MTASNSLQARRVMQQIEHKIPTMNHNAIHNIVGDINQADFEALAESIAIMRAKYLKKVIELSRLDQSELSIKYYAEVRHSKLAFEEAIESFSQLKRALERGHFTLSENDEGSAGDSQDDDEVTNED